MKNLNDADFAVVDVETTGFGKSDRILEIAIALVSNGRVVQEWETLINPQRDISNTDIHGIDATMVSLAPTFSEVADEITSLLNGRIFVAHNISFDSRMLRQEFDKLSREISFGVGFCTLKATNLSLERACESFGIGIDSAHRALSDMRATTELFLQLDKRNEDLMPVIAPQGKTRMPARILCRPELLGNDELAGMQTFRKTIPDFDDTGFSNSQLSYADALYGAMSDFSITNTETEYLSEWAQAVGVSEEERLEVHQDYLNQLVVAANRDGSISEQEKKAIESAALALAIRPPLFFTSKQTSFQLVDGVRVCFTGTTKGLDGNILTKDELAQIAVQKGLIPVASVTKKTCELVVTADLSSMSRKAQLARKYGISVISVTDFLNSK